MIRVNLNELENLSAILTKTASDAEEVYHRLSLVLTEMQDDLELATYPQTPVVLETATLARETLRRSMETLLSLRGVMATAANGYRETEQKHRAALERMTVIMDSANVGYHTAMSGDVPQTEHTEEMASHNDIQRLVADSVEDMQITNIAALTRAVQKEYPVNDVVDLTEEV